MLCGNDNIPLNIPGWLNARYIDNSKKNVSICIVWWEFDLTQGNLIVWPATYTIM